MIVWDEEGDFVLVNRSSHFQAVKFDRAGKYFRNPGPVVVNVAGITGSADDFAPAIAETDVVAEPQVPRRDVSFRQEANEMNGSESSTELYDEWPVDRRLQPRTVMKSGIPISNRSVEPAERKLEIIIVVIADDGALHLNSILVESSV